MAQKRAGTTLQRKSKIKEEIAMLEHQVMVLQEHLRAMQIFFSCHEQKDDHQHKRIKREHVYNSYDYDTQCDSSDIQNNNSRQWNLKLIHRSSGICLEATVQSIADIASFLRHSMASFASDSSHRYFSNGPTARDRTMRVTNRMLKVEEIMRNILLRVQNATDTPSSTTSPLALSFPDIDSQTAIHAKRQLFDAYFGCLGLVTPALVRSYYQPYLHAHPNSMLANALGAFILVSRCQHVDAIALPLSRHAFAECLFAKARLQLEDALFEQEQDDVDTLATLWCMGAYSLFTLKIKEGRVHVSMAWRMASQLKERYLAKQTDPVSIAQSETWRRIYYVVRYLEISMYMALDGLSDFSSIVQPDNIGFPTVLPCEESIPELKHAVQIYQYLICLSVLPSGGQATVREELTSRRLFAGALEAIPCDDLEVIERRVIGFWHALPKKYRLSEGATAYVDMAKVETCHDASVLYLNKMYYMYWLTIESRLMPVPATADLAGADLSRLDSERALVIVSVCCDAMAKILYVLYMRIPCLVELHWMTFVADLLVSLKDCANKDIQTRAQQNLQMTLWILNSLKSRTSTTATITNDLDSMGGHTGSFSSESSVSSHASTTDEDSPRYPDSPLSTPGSAIDKNMKMHIPVDYSEELRRQLQTYFADSVM